MISYFGLSGKMNSSEPISRITPTVMGTYGLTLNFVGIGFQKTQGIIAVERRMSTNIGQSVDISWKLTVATTY